MEVGLTKKRSIMMLVGGVSFTTVGPTEMRAVVYMQFGAKHKVALGGLDQSSTVHRPVTYDVNRYRRASIGRPTFRQEGKFPQVEILTKLAVTDTQR